MGYSSINAYDAETRIPGFAGLNQYGDTMNGDPRYADEAENLDTHGGILMPMAAPETLYEELPGPIETLMRVNYRRESSEEILVAACQGRLYTRKANDSEWQEAEMPEDIDAYSTDVWSWVDYEINEADEDGEANTVDVLLLSNEIDGMFMLRSDDRTVSRVRTPYNFGIIERHAERIWGTAIKGEPDLLVYSAPYDPTDWCARDPSYPDDPDNWTKTGQPEDGAGEIKQPTWDGDSFTALRTFGDQLIAFKRTHVWRIMGTNPGEYEIRQQYGGGAPAPATIAVDSERIYMLGTEGVSYYDGSTVEPFGQGYAEQVWRRMNTAAITESCACLWRGKYYLAFPMDGSAVNNAVMTYSLTDGTWLLRTDLTVESFLPGENALYFTDSSTPGQAWQYLEDSWETGSVTEAEQKWVSPWMTFGYKRMVMGPFTVRFMPEVQDRPVDLTIAIRTERGVREKTVRVHPLLGYEQRKERQARVRRIPFPLFGRRCRLEITAPAGCAPWRITDGIDLECDHEME